MSNTDTITYIETIHTSTTDEIAWQLISDSKASSQSESFFGSYAKVKNKLLVENKLGSAVFAVVNKVDSRQEGLTRRHVVAPSFTFTDDDLGLDWAAPLSTTMVVRSKAGRHTYWRFKCVEEELQWSEWGRCQRLAAMLMRTDPSMINPDRVLRVPGFLHQKDPANPYLVHIETLNKDAPALSIQDWESIKAYDETEWERYKLWWRDIKSIKDRYYPDYTDPDWKPSEQTREAEAAMAVYRFDSDKQLLKSEHGRIGLADDLLGPRHSIGVGCPVFDGHSRSSARLYRDFKDGLVSYGITCFSCNMTWRHVTLPWPKRKTKEK